MSPARAPVAIAARSARWVARGVSAVVEPAWYWLGWLDPDGHPANSKIIYSIAAITALGLCVRLGLRLVEKGQPLTLEYVALVCFVLLFCGSLEAFKKVIRMRFGGTGNGTEKAPATPAEPTP